jgi:hypothetical protein
MVKIAFHVGPETANCAFCYSIVEYLGKYLADIFAPEVLLDEGFGDDDAFINAANVDLFVTNIDDTGRADGRSEASHHTLQMDVYLFEANPVEDGVDKHLEVPPDKYVRNYDDAVETFPLFLRNFDLVFDEVDENVLEVRHSLLLFLLAAYVQGPVGNDLNEDTCTLRNIQFGFYSTLRASSP